MKVTLAWKPEALSGMLPTFDGIQLARGDSVMSLHVKLDPVLLQDMQLSAATTLSPELVSPGRCSPPTLTRLTWPPGSKSQ